MDGDSFCIENKLNKMEQQNKLPGKESGGMVFENSRL